MSEKPSAADIRAGKFALLNHEPWPLEKMVKQTKVSRARAREILLRTGRTEPSD